MGKNIRITAGSVVVVAELSDTDTASEIWVCYPSRPTATPRVMRYISEYPSKTMLRTGSKVVELGDLGYLPPGNAFCLFFGPTPASDVTVIGKIKGDSTVLKSVSSGISVLIEALS
jgi:hypothetical protein